jgi:hypothetical protein
MINNKINLSVATFIVLFCMPAKAIFKEERLRTPENRRNPLEFLESTSELRNLCIDPKNNAACAAIAKHLDFCNQNGALKKELKLATLENAKAKCKIFASPRIALQRIVLTSRIEKAKARWAILRLNTDKALNDLITPEKDAKETILFKKAEFNACHNQPQGPLTYQSISQRHR